MKKLTKILSGLACLALATSLIACKTPEDPTGGEAPGGNKNPSNVDKPAEENSSIWDGAEVVESLAGQKTSWNNAITMPSAYTKRIQVGSKVIFELEPIDDAEGNSYLKFHIDNGSWGACGVEEYFAADGSKLNVTEDEKNKGVFNSDSYENAVVAYFVVTDDNINALQAGFALQGNLLVKKVAITNLAAANPNDTAKLLEVSNCKEYTVTLTNPVTATSKLAYLLQIDNDGAKDATGLSITVTDLKLKVKIGDAEPVVKTFPEVSMIPDQYGSPAYEKTSKRVVLAEEEIKVGTKVVVQVVSAKIDNADKAYDIVFNLMNDDNPWANLGTTEGPSQDTFLPAFVGAEE